MGWQWQRKRWKENERRKFSRTVAVFKNDWQKKKKSDFSQLQCKTLRKWFMQNHYRTMYWKTQSCRSHKGAATAIVCRLFWTTVFLCLRATWRASKDTNTHSHDVGVSGDTRCCLKDGCVGRSKEQWRRTEGGLMMLHTAHLLVVYAVHTQCSSTYIYNTTQFSHKLLLRADIVIFFAKKNCKKNLTASGNSTETMFIHEMNRGKWLTYLTYRRYYIDAKIIF